MMELEAKYRVADRQVFVDLLRTPTLGELRLTPHPAAENQRNTYYDTADNRLAAQRASLRIREVGASQIATLKRSHGRAGAVHIREEWEVPIADKLHPADWPASPAREQALLLIGTTPLQELFSIQTRRRRVALARPAGMVAELSLDEGHISAGGRILGFRELEIELAGAGTLDDLERIGHMLATRFGLTAEPRGKRSRGLALLQALDAQLGVVAEPPRERAVGLA